MRIITSVTAGAVALFLASATAHAAATNISATQSTIKYSKTSTATSGFGNYARATSTVVYDPATDTYTVRDTGSLTTKSIFGPANISSSNATFVTYTKGTNETFRLLNKNPGNPLIVAYLCRLRPVAPNQHGGGTTNVNDTYLVFGTKAPASAVTSGTGSYSTIVDGTFVNKDRLLCGERQRHVRRQLRRTARSPTAPRRPPRPKPRVRPFRSEP